MSTTAASLPDFSSMSLRMRQELFSKLAAQLILFITSQSGYSVILGEILPGRFAISLNIFLHDQLIKKPDGLKFASDWWKALHPLCRWGGDLPHRDGNLFSIAYENDQA